MEDNTIRIDGREYVRGSGEARAAQVRLDALRNEAFLLSRPDLLERNVAIIRESRDLERIRTDANATALLARDLVYVSAEVERKVYEATRMMSFVRPDTSVPRGADSYARRTLDMTGEAKTSHTLAGDHPRADVAVSEELLPFRFVTGAYAYTVDDLERAAFARVPLAQWKREACIDMIARGIDKIGRRGTLATDAGGDVGLRGLFNNPFVTVHTLTFGEWLTATVAEILADLAEIEQTIIAAAKDTQPDDGYRLILPTTYEGRLKTLLLDPQSSITVANFFIANSRLIKSIERYGALDSAVTPEVAASDAPQGIVIPMNQQRSGIYWPMPISYEEQAPEVKGYEWITNARARVGGVEFPRSFNSLYVQNLD